MNHDNLKNNRKLTSWTLWTYRTIRKWPADNDPHKQNDILLTLENNWILMVYLYPGNKK